MSIFLNGIDRTPVNSLVLLNAAAGNEVANRMDYTINKLLPQQKLDRKTKTMMKKRMNEMNKATKGGGNMKKFILTLLILLLASSLYAARSMTFNSDSSGNVSTAKDLSITGQTTGDILYFDGANWVRMAKGANNSIHGVDNSGNLGYFTSITSGSITSGASPTIDAAGEITVDTTADQIKYFGTAAQISDPRRVENATFKTPTSGDKAKFKKPFGMTITAVSCVADAATSAILDVQECNVNGANCATILSATATCTTTNQNIPPTTGTPHIDDTAIAANNYVFISVGTIVGTPGFLYAGIEYTVTGE